jgi:hypothetical protein
MTEDNTGNLIREAEGYAELGLFLEAWEKLEDLPPDQRLLPGVIRVRLIVCEGLQKWSLGKELAALVDPPQPLSLREAAGNFLMAMSNHLCLTADRKAALEALRAAVDIWPEGRERAVQSAIMQQDWP